MELGTVNEGAAIIRGSHWTIRAWLRTGRLKSRYKAGGKTLVDLNEVRSLIRLETKEQAASRNSKAERAREAR